MPDITLTLTASQATACLEAIGKKVNADGKPATAAQGKAWLLDQLRVLVRQNERAKVVATADDTAKANSIAAGW